MKCIQVKEEVWKQLKKLKLEKDKRRINDVIEELIKKHEECQ